MNSIKQKILLDTSLSQIQLLVVAAQKENKKTGIHPIIFEDVNGNKITRLFDYDLGQFAKGDSIKKESVKDEKGNNYDLAIDKTGRLISLKTKDNTYDLSSMDKAELEKLMQEQGANFLNSLPQAEKRSVVNKQTTKGDYGNENPNNYELKETDIQNNQGENISLAIERLDKMDDAELQEFMDNPVKGATVLAENLLNSWDAVAGDSFIGNMLPSQNDRAMMATSIEKVKNTLTSALEKKGPLGAIATLGGMAQKATFSALPDDLKEFTQSPQFKNAVLESVGYALGSTLGAMMWVGVAFAAGPKAAANRQKFYKDYLGKPDGAKLLEDDLKKGFGNKAGGKWEKQMIEGFKQDFALAQKAEAPLKEGLKAGKKILGIASKVVPVLTIGLTTVSVANNVNQFLKERKDPDKKLAMIAKRMEADMSNLLADLSDRPEWQQHELIEKFARQQGLDIEDLQAQLAARGIFFDAEPEMPAMPPDTEIEQEITSESNNPNPSPTPSQSATTPRK